MRNPYEDDFAQERRSGLGAACAMCGEDAVSTSLMQKHSQEVPLCGACLDQVEQCPDCDQQFWGPDGYRLYDSANLYCASCASQHPVMVMGRELEARLDEGKHR